MCRGCVGCNVKLFCHCFTVRNSGRLTLLSSCSKCRWKHQASHNSFPWLEHSHRSTGHTSVLLGCWKYTHTAVLTASIAVLFLGSQYVGCGFEFPQRGLHELSEWPLTSSLEQDKSGCMTSKHLDNHWSVLLRIWSVKRRRQADKLLYKRKMLYVKVVWINEWAFTWAHFEEEDGAPLWRQNSFGLRQQPETMLIFDNWKEDMVQNCIWCGCWIIIQHYTTFYQM